MKDLIHNAAHRLLKECPEARSWMIDVPIESGTWAGTTLPFLSIRAFRSLRISQIPESQVISRFSSSGSTSGSTGARGTHLMGLTGRNSYAHAALGGYTQFLRSLGRTLADTTLVTMVPAPELWPTSSLSAMFEHLQNQGVPLVWSAPETLFDDAQALLKKKGKNHALVIFGTSMHHHLVRLLRSSASGKTASGDVQAAGPSPYAAQVLCIVDTGGAKGRTVILSAQDMEGMLRTTYGSLPHQTLICASQYGMCELSSQAWSLPHRLRDFSTSPTLVPLVIDPETLRPLAAGQTGYLGFIDLANVDSYPAILTEDLGMRLRGAEPEALLGTKAEDHSPSSIRSTEDYLLSPGEFRLLGRAPMANLKGCSLRVQEIPPRNHSEAERQPKRLPPVQRVEPLRAEVLDLSNLKSPRAPEVSRASQLFTSREWRALQTALDSCPSPLDLGSRPRREKGLLIIASANISITFLYPILAAIEQGFDHVDLVLPSMRDDDPLSDTVRSQIRWILEGLEKSFQGSSLSLRTLPEIPGREDLILYETLVVFGTNETVRLFSERFEAPGLRIFGFGEIMNILRWGRGQAPEDALSSPEEVAEACLGWRGRGCLTPRALIIPDELPNESELLQAFSAAFERIFEEEFRDLSRDVLKFFHWHTLIEIRALLGDLVDIKRQSGLGPALVDARKVPNEKLLTHFNSTWSGQGLLVLVSEAQIRALQASGGHPFVEETVFPGYADPHQGRSWRDWLAPPADLELTQK